MKISFDQLTSDFQTRFKNSVAGEDCAMLIYKESQDIGDGDSFEEWLSSGGLSNHREKYSQLLKETWDSYSEKDKMNLIEAWKIASMNFANSAMEDYRENRKKYAELRKLFKDHLTFSPSHL